MLTSAWALCTRQNPTRKSSSRARHAAPAAHHHATAPLVPPRSRLQIDNCGTLHASVKQAVAPHTLLTLAAELDPIGSKHKFGIAAKVLR